MMRRLGVVLLLLAGCGSSSPESGSLTQKYLDNVMVGNPAGVRELFCRSTAFDGAPVNFLNAQAGDPERQDVNGVEVTVFPVTAVRTVVGGENQVSFKVIEGDVELTKELDQAFNRRMIELGAPPIEVDPGSYIEEETPCIVGVMDYDDGSFREFD